MTQTEIAILLALANGHDQRQGIDDVRVQAWWDLLNQEAPDMPFEFAKETINRHYALVTGMVMPAHLVTAWKNYKARRRDQAAIPQAKGVPMPEWFREKVKGQSWE
jgi:hypothetical protein